MITLTSSSAHITTQTSPLPYVTTDSTNPTKGTLRTTNGQLQVFDNTWTTTNVGATVGMNRDAERAIEWAIRQMHRESKLKEMAERYPAVADALAHRDRAEEALNIVLRLCGELEQ
jgi:formate-dependent nitrite reductase cytochrome c552 subunit